MLSCAAEGASATYPLRSAADLDLDLDLDPDPDPDPDPDLDPDPDPDLDLDPDPNPDLDPDRNPASKEVANNRAHVSPTKEARMKEAVCEKGPPSFALVPNRLESQPSEDPAPPSPASSSSPRAS
jgi:hypothetical protein